MTVAGHVRQDRAALGIGIILVSVLTMAFADAVVKRVSADLTVWQIFFARSLVALPILFFLARFSSVKLAPLATKWVLVRSVLLVLTWLVFYAALPVLSLSVAAVAIYTNPIITALLSAMLLGERVTLRQWIGVLLGFVGVIVVLQPGTDAFSWFTALPLLGAVFYSLAMVLTRSKCQDEAPLSLALVLHVCFVATGLGVTAVLALVGLGPEEKAAFPFLFGDWAPMGVREWGVMALLGLLSAAYFVGVARAYQIAPPQVIATFDYAYLISAAVWGFVFFAETPTLITICGMVLTTFAGLLVAVRASTVDVTKDISAA